MSFGAPAPEAQQPADFAFTADNLAQARKIIAKYPDGRQQSALLPLLELAQRQNENWLPRAAMDYVSDLLEIPPIRAYEVASFYTMFNKAPVGRHFIQVCTTSPCWLCGSNDVLKAIKDKTGLAPGQSSADGAFTVVEVECLGACVNAPMVQINDDYFEDLDYQRMGGLIDALSRGEAPTIGSQIGRKGSQALSGPTTLLELPPVVVSSEGAAPKKAAKSQAAKSETAEPESKAEAKPKAAPKPKPTRPKAARPKVAKAEAKADAEPESGGEAGDGDAPAAKDEG